MSQFQKNGDEQIMYTGKIFEVIQQPMKSGNVSCMFEVARRAPGVRLIIVKDGKMLITKEFRHEINNYDYRLPGGKVFDTFAEYKEHIHNDMLPLAEAAARKECKEETGLIAKNIKHFMTVSSGATIIWDLYCFIIDDFEESADGQDLETGEDIEIHWMSFDQVKELCKNGSISEGRILGFLFRFFLLHAL